VDGDEMPILHISQIARRLGLSAPEAGEALGLGWELAATLERWVDVIQRLDLAELVAPTGSRGRSIRNLTVNAFHPVELLPDTFATGRFNWDPDGDTEREVVLRDADTVLDYAERIGRRWTSFLLEREDELRARDPAVSSPRGEVTFSELLESQRRHAGFHLDEIESATRARR
jgi:hypothetical protein